MKARVDGTKSHIGAVTVLSAGFPQTRIIGSWVGDVAISVPHIQIIFRDNGVIYYDDFNGTEERFVDDDGGKR